MSERNSHSENEAARHGGIHQVAHPATQPYWKRAHQDFRFWIGMVLMLAAITIYVLSDDLSLLPRGQPHVTPSGVIGKGIE